MRKLIFTGICGLFVLTLIAGGNTKSQKEAMSRNLNIFTSIYKELEMGYVDSIDVDKSMRTAIDAMLNRIDPYTEFIAEEDRDEFMTISTGEYGGMGAAIVQRGDTVCVSEPFEGSPAMKSGLRAGDRILRIDGDTMLKLGSSKVSERLRGKAGTEFVVDIKRPYADGSDSLQSITVKRETIDVNPVPFYGMMPDGIGYIQLTTFNEKSAQRVEDALLDLKKNPGLKGIVLDLSGNGGGLLESAVKIVGLFVPKGTEVLRTRGRALSNEKVYKTTSKPVDTEIPLVVLVDGGSASSSEIVTGALQDLDRAVIIGNRTYGKGLVQSTRQLPYQGLLKLTVAKYYIPSGRLIQAIDYSHRNPDGSVARIPDSLTTVYKTAGGREVRDGGGITPDIKVTLPEGNRLVYNIVRDFWAFDYATRFASRQKSIAPVEEFVVTDSIYEDFKKFIDPSRLNYDKVCEVVTEQLEKAAEQEGYMTDSVRAQIDILKGMLRHDLNKDLDTHRADISRYLATEIVTRYYNQKGAIREALKYDAGLDSASRIILDPARYRKILGKKQ